MTYLTLGGSLALAAFLAIYVLAWTLAALIWRTARADLGRLHARARAGGAFTLRTFPAMAAAVVVLGVFLPAFRRFEPRDTAEVAGQSLVVLAVLSAVLLARAAARGWQAARDTRRVVRGWMADARPVRLAAMRVRAYAIRTRFPVVSVVGVIRPRVFVSERVLRECTVEELAAVLRHECGHLAAADNLKRLLLRVCATPLPLALLDRDLERDWHEACEEAADDYVATGSTPAALALANALLRIARMAPPGCPVPLPAASFYNGAGIERRVRRLLGATPHGAHATRWLAAARGLALVPFVLAVAVFVDTNLLHAVHHLIEAVVETLP